MGCDIHIALEKLNNKGQWVDINAYKINEYYDPDDEWEKEEYRRIDCYRGRNYELFSALCGVRSNGEPKISEPRGLPHDCSSKIKSDYASWGVDAHSANWNTFDELVYYNEQNPNIKRSGMVSPEVYANLQNGVKPNSWCGWTNIEGWVECEWDDVACAMDDLMGSIKGYLRGILYTYEYESLMENPKKLRLVYWFDN
jgi:hypothetical protein